MAEIATQGTAPSDAPAALAAIRANGVAPPARAARPRRRHYIVLLSLFAVVAVPVCALAFYLWIVAADQFHSTVGFSVRKEEVSSTMELLGGITALSGSSSSDTDILYEYIQSQKMVALLDERLDLRALWSKPAFDPLFAYDADGTIEDLISYWAHMVQIYYDGGSGLIEVRVRAFDPDDAQLIAKEIFTESSAMINELSAVARADAVRYALEELDTAVERLKAAREAITLFRNENRLVDPTADLQTQAGLLGTLQVQLAEGLIQLDLLRETSQGSDPRVLNAERRVDVIQKRIDAEQRKRGITSSSENEASNTFSTLVGEYERLIVDREFAEQTYVSSLAARDASLAEARRQTRYLAAHIQPTLAERSLFPQRLTILGLFALFMFMVWSITALVVYSLRDRR